MKPHVLLDAAARESASLYALGALDRDEVAGYEAHLAECAPCRAEVEALRPTVQSLAAAAREAAPPAHLKQRLMDRAAQSVDVQAWKSWAPDTAATGAGRIVRRDPAGFEPTGVEGVEVRKLFVDPAAERVTMLVRMAAGSSYPAHRHADVEECYVLEGDLYSDDFEMQAGDYQRLTLGSKHGVQATRQGCLLFIVSSMRDELLPLGSV